MAPRREFEIVIVGAGIAGASLAYFLAERGQSDVLLLEREAQLAVHSTGRSAATLAQMDSNPTLLELKVLSAPFFHRPPPGFSPSPLLRQTGVLGVYPEAAWSVLQGAAQHLREVGLGFNLLSPAQACARVSALSSNEIAGALFVPSDGRLDVHEVLSSYLRHARQRGATLELGVEVTEFVVEGGRCRGVATASGEIRAGLVVDAGGAWAGTLAQRAGAAPIPIQPKRRTIFTFPPPPDLDCAGWPMVSSDAHSIYFAPEVGDLMLSPMDEVDMAPCDPTPDDETIAAAIERLGRLAPPLVPRTIRRRWSGLRSFAPDRVLVVGEDPRLPGFFWLAGQGGCGIETSPTIGRIAADLIVAGRTDRFDAARLAPDRFAAARASGASPSVRGSGG
jgi:D-arginine dehydrogenase